MKFLFDLDARFTRWLTGNESNASGRLGLYRILFALFYLNITQGLYPVDLAELPASVWRPILATIWLPAPPSVLSIRIAEVVLVGALVLLAFGLRVRLMTLLVLISGVFVAGVRFSFNKVDHADTFMIAYIPLVMLFSNWGATYSLDALLARRRGALTVDPNISSWHYAWPIRVILWLICIMYMMSGIQKFTGDWTRQFDVVRILMFNYNLSANPNPLNPIIANTPVLHIPLQIAALLFETGFPVAIISKTWRTFALASAIMFHLFIMLFMHISFAPMFIAYALFVDWQWIYERLNLSRLRISLEKVPNTGLILGACGLAALIVGLWQSPTTRALLPSSVWTLHYLWWIVVPVAVVALIRSGKTLLLGLLRRPNDTVGVPAAQ